MRDYIQTVSIRVVFAAWGNIYGQVCEDAGPMQESLLVAGRERNRGKGRGEESSRHLQMKNRQRQRAESEMQLKEPQFGQLNPIRKS